MASISEQIFESVAALENSCAVNKGDLAIKDATINYLEHKLQRLEEFTGVLKEQIKDELSHHARYNAIKADTKDCLNDEERKKLLSRTRETAMKLLKPFLAEQEATYVSHDDKELQIAELYEKKIAELKKKKVAARSGGGKLTKSISKKKGMTADGTVKRKSIAVPRARFIAAISPQYNAEKRAAKAAGNMDFPSLFVYVKIPWDTMDPDEKKRKYIDPFEAEKKERAAADLAAGRVPLKKSKKTPVVVAAESENEETDGEAAVSDDDDAGDDDNSGDDDDDVVPSVSDDDDDDVVPSASDDDEAGDDSD